MSTKRILLTVIVIAVIAGGGLLVYQFVAFTSNQRTIMDRVLVKGGLDIYCASEPNTTKSACDIWTSTILDAHYEDAKACYNQYDYLKQRSEFGACLTKLGTLMP